MDTQRFLTFTTDLTARSSSRRRFLRGVVAGAGLGFAARLGFSGDAAAQGDFAAIDPLAVYPEFLVRLTTDRIEAPTRAFSGRFLVVQENLGEEHGHSFLMRFPDELTEKEIATAFSPETATEETPAWFFDALFPGMPDRAAPNGGRAVGLIDFIPGRWVAGSVFRPPWEWARFDVLAGTPFHSATDPQVDVVAGMREMAFEMPSVVAAGPRLWKVENAGALLHEIAIVPVPNGATIEQVTTAFGAQFEAEVAGDTPSVDPLAALGPAWAEWQGDPIAGIGVISPERAAWGRFDLAPGTYAAVCFIPDEATFTFHLMMGMTKVFTVVAPDFAATFPG